MTPMPPSCAMAIAMRASVTVSIAALSSGMLSATRRESRVATSASRGRKFDDARHQQDVVERVAFRHVIGEHTTSVGTAGGRGALAAPRTRRGSVHRPVPPRRIAAAGGTRRDVWRTMPSVSRSPRALARCRLRPQHLVAISRSTRDARHAGRCRRRSVWLWCRAMLIALGGLAPARAIRAPTCIRARTSSATCTSAPRAASGSTSSCAATCTTSASGRAPTSRTTPRARHARSPRDAGRRRRHRRPQRRAARLHDRRPLPDRHRRHRPRPLRRSATTA